jgi:class 3 adenylate cyclase
MEPRIQYVRTSDGLNIAYAVFGAGPTIIFAGSLWGDIHMYKANVANTGTSQVDELVSLGWSVIMHDSRGMGSSDRNNSDWTVEAMVRDLEAVVGRAAPERFALWGRVAGGPAAIAYTTQHPERVNHLILSNTYAAGAEWYDLVPAMRISQQMLGEAAVDWNFHLLTLANAVTGYADSQLAGRLAAAWGGSMAPEAYMEFRCAAEEIDVRNLLPQIAVPTLVIHDTSLIVGRFGVITQRLAPSIPDARFIETEEAVRVVDEFLREREDVATREAAIPHGTVIILFADIADSTALTERLGDAGTPIEGKLLGDGVLAVFASARQAIEAALACGRAGDDAGLPLHLGLHAGDVIREDNNVYGGAVNIASRISELSAPGEVLVSDIVRGLARTSAGVRFEDRGERRLKGVAEPTRVYKVMVSGAGG